MSLVDFETFEKAVENSEKQASPILDFVYRYVPFYLTLITPFYFDNVWLVILAPVALYLSSQVDFVGVHVYTHIHFNEKDELLFGPAFAYHHHFTKGQHNLFSDPKFKNAYHRIYYLAYDKNGNFIWSFNTALGLRLTTSSILWFTLGNSYQTVYVLATYWWISRLQSMVHQWYHTPKDRMWIYSGHEVIVLNLLNFLGIIDRDKHKRHHLAHEIEKNSDTTDFLDMWFPFNNTVDVWIENYYQWLDSYPHKKAISLSILFYMVGLLVSIISNVWLLSNLMN